MTGKTVWNNKWKIDNKTGIESMSIPHANRRTVKMTDPIRGARTVYAPTEEEMKKSKEENRLFSKTSII